MSTTDKPGKVWLNQFRTMSTPKMSKRAKIARRWIRLQKTLAGQSEKQLKLRYPWGWEFMLDDPEVVFEVIHKAMSAKGKPGPSAHA